MYAYRSRRRKSFFRRNGLPASLMAIGLISSSFGFLMPANSDVDVNARVFSEGLNIKLDRSSPAYAALEDSWLPSQDAAAKPADASVQTVSLGAGTSSVEPIVQKIERANQREQSLYAQERASREAMSQAMAQAATEVLKKMAERFQPHAPAPEAENEAATMAQAEKPATETRTISLAQLKISREELIGSLILPIAKSDGALEQGTLSASRANLPRFPTGARAGQSAEAPTNNAAADRPDRAKAESSNAQPTMVAASELSNEEPSGRVLRQVVISGQLEFVDGLAFSNSLDRLVVYREVDGETLEAGAVWLREGRYEIFVEETTGVLLSELRTPYGDVIGRGQYDLSQLPAQPVSAKRIENVPLKIKPVIQGISGRVLASRNDGARQPVKAAAVEFRDLPFEANANREGHYEQNSLLEGSTAIIKASRPGYWGTLAFAHAGSENDIEIFPNQDGQMIHHLVALSRSARGSTESAAIIWGKVMRGGKPLAGARVELPTTAEEMRPIYFNAAMVPDPSLRETSANGLYAFFPVAPGAHAVQAVVDRRYVTEPLVFPAEQRTVSRVDIETNTDRHARVKVFDAFRTDYPLRSEVSTPGSSKSLSIDRDGIGELKYAGGRGLLILDSDSGPGYLRARLAMSRDRRAIYVPMVQSVWLEKIRGALRLNPVPHSGTIIGFVQGSAPYKIAMEERSLSPSSKVVYFNSRGEVLPQEYGEPGGGFVVFNVPEGFRTVTVQPSGSAKIFSSVALVEPSVASIISHWIR